MAVTVALLDDNEIVREVVGAHLERLGYEVIVLRSPFSLASALAEHRADVALVDVSMPGIDGDHAVRALRRHAFPEGSACKVILYSDRSEPELAQMMMDCGADDFISKARGTAHLAQRLLELFMSD